MGLDMYLIKMDRDDFESGEPLPESEVYWRKASAIHCFFENNANDGDYINCNPIEVSTDILLDLRKKCKRIIRANKKNKMAEIAEEELPTCHRFFFGDTLYNEHYLKQLMDTIDGIDKVLDKNDNEIILYDAWW